LTEKFLEKNYRLMNC